MFGGQFHIKMVNGVHHFFDGEIVADEVRAGPAESLAQRGIAGKLEQTIFQAGQITGSQEESGFTIETNFAGAITIISEGPVWRRRAPAAAPAANLRAATGAPAHP